MSDKPHDATPKEIAEEEGIQRLDAEAAVRQSNVLPLDAAMNEERFYGLLIRGGPLGGVQQLGFFFMGIMLAGFALVQIRFIFPGCWWLSEGGNLRFPHPPLQFFFCRSMPFCSPWE